MKKVLFIFGMLLMSFQLFSQTQADSLIVPSEEVKFDRWRFSVQEGGAYRTARLDPSLNGDMKDYAKKLKRGLVYEADLTFFFSRAYGIGVQYSNMSSFARQYVTASFDDGSTQTGYLTDKLNIIYAGPFFAVRESTPDGRHRIYGNYGLGMLSYHDAAELIEPFTMTGSTIGYRVELGYDFRLTGKFYIGALLSLTSGVLYDVTVSDATGSRETVKLSSDDAENLSRIALSVGFRWNL